MKKLVDNIDEIEKTVSLYSSNKLEYTTAYAALISFGYSHKEASIILKLKEGEPYGSSTRHRNR